MQLKNKRKNVRIPLLILCFLLVFVVATVPLVSCDQENSVNVKFQILTGSGSQNYFTGDYFWYNITLTNSGTTDINATFTVTVRNTTGGIFGQIEPYQEYLGPNDTAMLYPSFVTQGEKRYYIYFMDTVGTYTIELTCDTPMTFYRYYDFGRYTVEYNVCHMDIDAMPSYQKQQNDNLNQYIQQSEGYMNSAQAYATQAEAEASSTRNLAKISIVVAVIAVILNMMALPKIRREEFKTSIQITTVVLLIILVVILFIY
jgi:uncharacterized membrane protein YwzB